MSHGKRWTFQKGCRCEPCRVADRDYKNAWSHRTGRSVPGRKGIAYSQIGIKVDTVAPEILLLLKLHGTQRRVAKELGISEESLYRILLKIKPRRGVKSRPQQRITLALAMRITELARGSRGLEHDWREAQKRKAKNDARSLRGGSRDRHGSRRKQVAEAHLRTIRCKHCDWGAETNHALYLHSCKVHGDPTQGKHYWSQKRRTKPEEWPLEEAEA